MGKADDLQMSEALARWDRDGGAPAQGRVQTRNDFSVRSTGEAVLTSVAAEQGLMLDCRRDTLTKTSYRLRDRRHALSENNDLDFKLTLEDIETILMYGNCAE